MTQVSVRFDTRKFETSHGRKPQGWGAWMFQVEGSEQTLTVPPMNFPEAKAWITSSLRSRITDLGYEIFPRERQTPEALSALQKADAEKWWPIIKELGIKAE